MTYIKAIVVSLVVALAIIFMIQNIEPLSHLLSVRLDLFLLKLSSTPYPIYLIILLAFFVGLFLASLLGVAERFRLRRLFMRQQKKLKQLSSELDSLRNLPINGESLPTGAEEGRRPLSGEVDG